MQHTSWIISCTTGNQLGQNPTGTSFFFFFHLCFSKEKVVYLLEYKRPRMAQIPTWPPVTTGYHDHKTTLSVRVDKSEPDAQYLNRLHILYNPSSKIFSSASLMLFSVPS